MKLWLSGIQKKSGEAVIRTAAAQLGLQVENPDEADLDAIGQRLSNGDMLLAGPRHWNEQLPGQIEHLSLARPGVLLLVLEGGANSALRAACLRAGALEVLPPEPGRQELELALGRAATLIQRFERQFEDEKIQNINQLAVSVNHEVNNPLMGLMGTAEMILMENENLSEKVQRDLRTVIDQARRIQSITLRLRDLNHLRTVPYDDRASMIDLLGKATQPYEDESRQKRETVRAGSRSDTPLPTEVFESPRLLIVDDNQLIIDLIHRLLDERFEIDHSTRPSEALQKIRKASYELILLDLVLPEMDGLELFRAMRQFRPDQRVILTTGYDSDPRIATAIEEGAINWIQKPFKFEALEKMLHLALQPHRTAVP